MCVCVIIIIHHHHHPHHHHSHTHTLTQLRSKRLAPVLIKEITRRVNCENVWQAVYTAGVVLPKPVAGNRYWHRSLNPKKLIKIQFSRLRKNMTMNSTIKLYRVEKEVSHTHTQQGLTTMI